MWRASGVGGLASDRPTGYARCRRAVGLGGAARERRRDQHAIPTPHPLTMNSPAAQAAVLDIAHSEPPPFSRRLPSSPRRRAEGRGVGTPCRPATSSRSRPMPTAARSPRAPSRPAMPTTPPSSASTSTCSRTVEQSPRSPTPRVTRSSRSSALGLAAQPDAPDSRAERLPAVLDARGLRGALCLGERGGGGVRVLEPSPGTGALCAFTLAAGATVHANELCDRRARPAGGPHPRGGPGPDRHAHARERRPPRRHPPPGGTGRRRGHEPAFLEDRWASGEPPRPDGRDRPRAPGAPSARRGRAAGGRPQRGRPQGQADSPGVLRDR